MRETVKIAATASVAAMSCAVPGVWLVLRARGGPQRPADSRTVEVVGEEQED